MNLNTNTIESESTWANPLARHLAIIIAAKLLLLFALWFLFFRMPNSGPTPGSDIHYHIAGQQAVAESTQTD